MYTCTDLPLVLTLLFFLFLLPSLVLPALDPNKSLTQYRLHIWNMESGLPTNSVVAVQQTRDGYLWIGTNDGLVRFDGIRFESYNREKPPQLKSSIRALYVDKNGILWIGTTSSGLVRYKDGRFTTYPITKYGDHYEIRAINEDRWGNLWIGSLGGGLTCLKGKEFTTYTTTTPGQGLPDNEVRFIYKDGNEDLWVTTTAGIVKLLEPGVFRVYVSHKDLPCLITACLYDEDTKDLWIGTGDSGLFRLRNGALSRARSGTFTSYHTEAGVPSTPINYLYKDSMDTLWIGTDGGLIRMKNEVFQILPGSDDPVSGYVYSIYEDREGSLWFGTLDGGLHQLRDSKFTNYTTSEGLAHDYINCIHKGQADSLWIGTKGGLNLLSLKSGKLITPLTTGQRLLDNSIICIFEDPSGYLWIGTWGGLQQFKDGKFTLLTKKDGLSDNRITCIFKDKQGDTWIGTESGLNRFNHGKGNFDVFTRADGLLSNRIEVIDEDRRGNLWIGTDAGLNRFSEGKITVFDPGGELKNKFIRYIYEDKEGVFWFGTESGLIRVAGVTIKEKETTTDVYFYNIQSGLKENRVYSILEDENGYLWLGGQNGISRIKRKELEDFAAGKIAHLEPDSYDEKDGMKSRWCTGSGFKTPDGRFWFPTSMGVTVIDPANMESNPLPPTIIIEQFTADGESVNMSKSSRGPVALAPGKKRLEFYYTSVSFINPQKMTFKLKLVGYDRDWIDMGTTRHTTYTGLSPGHYTLKARVCNSDGVWNREGASFSFYLKPYFYQTAWFYILIALLVIMAAVSFYLFRVRQLKTRERELSRLVERRTRDLKERTVELEKAHYKLRESNEIIETKNRHITDSIRYAHKIQQAMLPIKERMAKELQDYFVIYKPRDIVSGDFYWFDVIDDRYFLALADCTGHGVPGALLSMIGYMMLNEVVNERRIHDPALALSHLHQGFRRILKQEMGEIDAHAYTYDGMDVGLCRMDVKAGKITFAGARHSLFYSNKTGLIEVKGNKKSIGGRQKEEKRFFTNHEIAIGNQMMIYLTSDGFADQPNPANEKYGSRRLKGLLQAHAQLGAKQQEEVLLKELARHQGGEEQRDDITVLGIRLHA
jgi:ligand-binding sensor domain-containing protein/serine phosphatase RsbU (regulator of sigma subunit)